MRYASNGYMTQAMIANTVNRNGIGGLPEVLFPMEGEKSAGNETTSFVGLHIPDLSFHLGEGYKIRSAVTHSRKQDTKMQE